VKYVKENGSWKFADTKYVRPWPINPTYGALKKPKKQAGGINNGKETKQGQ